MTPRMEKAVNIPQRPILEGIPLRRVEGLVMVMDTPKGRGVFAARDIPARTVLEVSPVLVLDPVENEEHIRNTVLWNYTYNWPYTPPSPSPNSELAPAPETDAKTPSLKSQPTTTQALILGLGSLFNHSNFHQNVGWSRDIPRLLITYTSLRDISAGEELCIYYGQRLTFKDVEAEEFTEGREGEQDWTEILNRIDLID